MRPPTATAAVSRSKRSSPRCARPSASTRFSSRATPLRCGTSHARRRTCATPSRTSACSPATSPMRTAHSITARWRKDRTRPLESPDWLPKLNRCRLLVGITTSLASRRCATGPPTSARAPCRRGAPSSFVAPSGVRRCRVRCASRTGSHGPSGVNTPLGPCRETTATHVPQYAGTDETVACADARRHPCQGPSGSCPVSDTGTAPAVLQSGSFAARAPGGKCHHFDRWPRCMGRVAWRQEMADRSADGRTADEGGRPWPHQGRAGGGER